MNIITQIRKSYITKGVAVLLAFNMVGEFIWPTAAMALTSGPSQPEYQSFEPVETTDMVNLFTGDFTYNIPLMNVPGPNGGYPINLAYHANPTMDQEASWVGLGWTINAGAINRQVRGVPDDFDGDVVKETNSIKDNWTATLGMGGCTEIFGADACEGLNVNLGFNARYNSYRGFGYSVDPTIGIQSTNVGYNLGFSIDSDDGVGVNAEFNFIDDVTSKRGDYELTGRVGIGFNSQRGLDISTSVTTAKIKDYRTGSGLNAEISTKGAYEQQQQDKKDGYRFAYDIRKNLGESSTASSGIGFAEGSHIPATAMPMNNYRLGVSVAAGGAFGGFYQSTRYSGSYDVQRLKNKGKEVGNETYGYENMDDKTDFGDFSRFNDGQIRKTSSNLATPQLTYDYYGILGQGIGGSFRPYRNQVGRISDPHVLNFTTGAYLNLNAGGNHTGWGGGATVGYGEQQKWDRKNNGKNFAFDSSEDLWENWSEIKPLYKKKENVYYKVRGDKSTLSPNEMDFIGGEKPITGTIDGNGFLGNYGWELPTDADLQNDRNIEERIARNNLIHKVTNEEINSFHSDEVGRLTTDYAIEYPDDYLHEFEVFHYDWDADGAYFDHSQDPTHYLERNTEGSNYRAGHHTGGYKVLDQSGSYFVYGLPAYNGKKIQKSFSINAVNGNGELSEGEDPISIFENQSSIIPLQMNADGSDVDYKLSGTHEYYSKTETPAYAYSYLLTSILGADYIDVDNNGPSDGDLGYWVKMDYVKYADNYKWRAPFKGCLYSEGNPSTLEDDKGSYQYGEKEIWYMSRIQTETHIAIFELDPLQREDNYEAKGEFTDKNEVLDIGEKSGLRLMKIKLYEKAEYFNDPETATPIQTVHFDYEYKLCRDIENSIHPENSVDATERPAKLTLTKVWFTYEGNSRGALNPYVFHYAKNPDYSHENYDRWGNYKGNEALRVGEDGKELNQILPYVNQYHQGYWDNEEGYFGDFQFLKDVYSMSWNLDKIDLPSGGQIKVQYEADDYAYVQSERATQMTYLTSVNDAPVWKNRLNEHENDLDINPVPRRVYFKLEEPIATGYGSEFDFAQKIFGDYVNDLVLDEEGKRNLYFRLFFRLKGDVETFVSGYTPLEKELFGTYPSEEGGTESIPHYGVAEPVEGKYTQGFITLECAKDKKGDPYAQYHPFRLAAWQYMRNNTPKLVTDGGSFEESDYVNKKKEQAKVVKNLVSWVPEIIKTFKGYRKYCKERGYASSINLDQSMIRLTSPDRKKYGGGSRVKQITMSDNWESFTDAAEDTETYGVEYDYSTSEIIDGEEVFYSSGVAQYEPMIGGDEIALRYPKHYPGKVPFFTDNNLFYEHPVNEEYMPPPVVGYSKVTVKSKNTASQIKAAEDGVLSPESMDRGVSGVKVYEFYTSKEYPVISDETQLGTENNTMKNWNVPLFIPFIATYSRNKIAATQGYKIELNDMHGKTKSIATYGLNENYQLLRNPTSKIVYNYNSEHYMYRGKRVKRLKNTVPCLDVDPTTHAYTQEDRMVGVDYEFFTDQRHSKNAVLTLGFNANIDLVTFPGTTIPVPSMWGTVNSSKTDVRTFVTNKIIHKSALLSDVVSINESFVSKTENLVYDKVSGRSLLSRIDNEYGDPVYSLDHPAHLEYEGMGNAYQNINVEFRATLNAIPGTNKLFEGDVPSQVYNELVPGDEFIVRVEDGTGYRNYKGTFISKNYGGEAYDVVIYIEHFAKNQSVDWGGSLTAFFKVYRSGRRNHFLTDAGSLITQSNPMDASNYTSSTDSYTLETGETVSLNVRKMTENVLGAGAIVYKDNWESTTSAHENPYQVGEMGIWRPYKTYAYAGERTQSEDGSGNKKPDLRQDGIMNNVPMFNWQVYNYERFASGWEQSGEITRLNKFGYGVESVDRLGIYSAALYGYKHSFPIGVGENASYNELGTQDFEMFEAGTAYDSGEGFEDEGNMNFYTNITPTSPTREIEHSNEYTILDGKSGVDNYVIINREYDPSEDWSIYGVDIAVTTFNNSGKQELRMFRAKNVTASYAGYLGQTKLMFDMKHNTIDDGEDIVYLPNSNVLGGKVNIYRKIEVDNPYNSTPGAYVEVSGETAHTGKQSLKLNGSNIRFTHGKLQLKANKTYVLSYWVKSANPIASHKISFEDAPVSVRLKTADGAYSGPVMVKSHGRMIEGWQKMEVEFTATEDNQILQTSFSSVDGAIYIDDVRIAPKTGGILTYVYDKNNFRLVAVLNANNYATLYYYDEQGNLYLTKQETEDGIFTVSGGYGHSRASSVVE